MKKEMTIFYEVHDNIYVNLTNKCPCACTFCLRQTRDHMENSHVLWLEHAPSFEEVQEAMKAVDFSKYKEVVFCGFGEPTEALDVLKQSAKLIKEKYNMPIRINTNGLGNLVNERDIVPELKGLVDTISVSLNMREKQFVWNHRICSIRCCFNSWKVAETGIRQGRQCTDIREPTIVAGV